MAELPPIYHGVGGTPVVDKAGNRYDSKLEESFGRYLSAVSDEWVHHPRPPSGRYYFRGRDGAKYEPDYLVKDRKTGVWIVYEVKPLPDATYLERNPREISGYLRKMETVWCEMPWVALAFVPWGYDWMFPRSWLLNLGGRWRLMKGLRQVAWWKMPP